MLKLLSLAAAASDCAETGVASYTWNPEDCSATWECNRSGGGGGGPGGGPGNWGGPGDPPGTKGWEPDPPNWDWLDNIDAEDEGGGGWDASDG